jgi:hypothetical protein
VTMIDRYLRAVRSNLPRSQQDDIIQELSENLHAQFEDEEAARGRPLLDTEQAAILKRFGNPLVVAARYRGDQRSVTFGRQLIGPELFPFYAKVLAINVAITLAIGLVILLATGGSIWSALYGVAVPLVFQFVIVTAVFVAIDRRFASDPDRWDPRTVGSGSDEVDYGTIDGIAESFGKTDKNRVPYTTSALELGLLIIGLNWWLAIGVPSSIGGVKPGPGWADLYWPVTVLIVAAFIVPIVNLVRPRWVQFRAAGQAVLYALWIVVMVVSLALGSWIVLVDPSSATESQVSGVDIVNSIIRLSIAIAIVFTAVSLALELRRLVRARS